MVLVGDVKDRTAIIVDDMADTCGTLVKAADVVIQHGAKDVIAIVTHGILSGNAIEALNGSKLRRIVVTNTVPHEEKKERCDRIETIDISPTASSTECLRVKQLLTLDLARGSLSTNTQRGERVFLVQACANGLKAWSCFDASLTVFRWCTWRFLVWIFSSGALRRKLWPYRSV